jgi:hypothetical protein
VTQTQSAVDQVRADVQSLYKRIREDAAGNQSALRTDMQNARMQAQQLASSLRTIARDRSGEEQQHLEHAAVLLEAAAAGVRNKANASAAELRGASAEMLERTRDALENISQAVAALRAAAVKQHA